MNEIPVIQHKYKDEILTPLGAVESNLDFILNKKGVYVTSDGVEVDAVIINTLHTLSQECIDKVSDLYGLGMDSFLQRWWDILGWHFNSMELLNIKLTKR